MKNSVIKESQIYLSFLRQNLVILALPLILGAGLGFLYSQHQPSVYSSNLLLQMDFTEDNLRERAILTDQATTILRSSQIHQQLKTDLDNKLVIFKSGPVAITVSSEGLDRLKTQQDVNLIENFALESYPIKPVGQVITEVKTSKRLTYLLIGGLLGGALGLIVSLIRTYLRRY